MEKLEYLTEIRQGGYLPVPDAIRARLVPFTTYKIKVYLELIEDERTEYSFQKARKLLSPIKGNMSDDILADRGERL
jgi:hypothetical protein